MSARAFHAVDPRSGEAGPAFTEATPFDVRGAVAAAEAAFAAPALRDDGRRAELLSEAAGRLRDAAEEIVAVCQAETGLPEVRVRSELERTWRQIEAFGALVEAGDYVDAIIDTADPDARPIPRPDVRRMLVPIGPVAVFGASNFPLAFSTAGGDTASALAAGCPVIVKGHPSHPGTSAVVAREVSAAVERSGSPRAPSRCCRPAGSRSATPSSTQPADRRRRLHRLARRRPRDPRPRRRAARTRSPSTPRWAASTRSSSPRPRCARARTRSPRASTASVATFGGQLCTKPGVVFVPAGAAGDAFVADVAARLEAADPQVMLNERLRDALAARVERARASSPRPRPRTAPAAAPAGPGFRFAPAAYRAAAADLAREPAAPRGALRPGRAAARLPLRGGAARGARSRRGPAHRLAARRARGRGARPTLVDVARRARRAARLRRLPDRRRRHPRHDARRPVPGDDRARAPRRSA